MPSINIQLNLTGIANGSDATTQQPTIVFQNLPFSVWGAMSSPRAVTGRVIGIAQPSQYKVALFAVEGKQQYLGGTAWVVDVADDGSFQVSVGQSSMDYAAVLMTQAFAQQYVESAFGGGGMIDALPLPVDHPGDVLLLAAVPAGLDRKLLLGDLPPLPPGRCWVNTQGGTIGDQISPAPTNQDWYDPAQPDQGQLDNLWFQFLLHGRGPYSFNIVLRTERPDGTAGNGAFVAGVYAYGNDLYSIAGAGPLDPSSPVAPVVTASQILDWQVFAPSMVQLNMALTILPSRLMLAMDVINVEPSVMAQFLKAVVELEKTLLALLLDEL